MHNMEPLLLQDLFAFAFADVDQIVLSSSSALLCIHSRLVTVSTDMGHLVRSQRHIVLSSSISRMKVNHSLKINPRKEVIEGNGVVAIEWNARKANKRLMP